MDNPKDWLGQEIFKGALVLYARSYGSSSVEKRLGRVVELSKDVNSTPVVRVGWLNTNKYSLPGAKATKVGVEKLTVMPESFALLAGEDES